VANRSLYILVRPLAKLDLVGAKHGEVVRNVKIAPHALVGIEKAET